MAICVLRKHKTNSSKSYPCPYFDPMVPIDEQPPIWSISSNGHPETLRRSLNVCCKLCAVIRSLYLAISQSVWGSHRCIAASVGAHGWVSWCFGRRARSKAPIQWLAIQRHQAAGIWRIMKASRPTRISLIESCGCQIGQWFIRHKWYFDKLMNRCTDLLLDY